MDRVRLEELADSVRSLMTDKDYKGLKTELTELYPMDLAEIFEEFTPDECVIMFRLLHKDQAAEVFSYLGTQQRKRVVSVINANLLENILDELYFDDKIDFLEEMPSNYIKSVIANSPPEERTLINQFLNFPDNSAGSLMTIEFVDLKRNMTVVQALGRIKQTGVDKESIYNCYVLDDTRRLEGIVSLRRLVLSDDDMIINEIMNDDVVLVKVDDDQEKVAELFKRYDLIVVPVVDNEKRLVGIITIDDIVDVIEQENTEDFQKMAAMVPSTEEYMETGVFTMARRRIAWLLVLMISATFTGSIIAHFEYLLSTAVVLAVFIPMLMNSGGNAGAQSSTLIIRGIALGDVGLSDWLHVMWKEFRVSLIVGAILALVNYSRMFIIGNAEQSVMITVSLALMFTVVAAKMTGGILPILAKSLNLDPAIMAGPLISTIVDALTLMIYFTIASFLIL